MSGIKLRPIVFKVVQPPYVLLDEKAAATYDASFGTIYTPPTFTTDKDFICYKMAVHRNADNTTANILLSYYVSSSSNYGWFYHVSDDGATQYIATIASNSYTSPTPLTAGTNGVSYNNYDSAQCYKAEPAIPSSTTEFTTVKFVFQKSNRKAYFYIDGKQIAICNDYKSAWNPMEIALMSGSLNDMTFGIQVYACDSLEAALEC